MAGDRPKLLLFVAEDWYFWSHRLPLAQAAMQRGYDVVLVTRVDALRERIESLGIRVVSIDISRSGMKPLREYRLLDRLVAIYRAERPDIVHHVAMKPVLYGSYASWRAGIAATVNALAGLGFAFASRSRRAALIRPGLRIALRLALSRRNSLLILQNEDDVAEFVDNDIVDRRNVRVIRGSGVDTSQFAPHPEAGGAVLVVLPARMLRDKGVLEFVGAARMVRASRSDIRFVLAGDIDPDNPASLSIGDLRGWAAEGSIEWWGHCSDMPGVFARCHIVCLPSYREGLPKALLEAAACGRCIVASDVPGCREIVRHGENGLLVPARDTRALAAAILELADDPGRRAAFGEAGRKIVCSEFSQESVVAETLDVYGELLVRSGRGDL